MKQTAVEWLVQWGKENPVAFQSDYYEAIRQAKEMEKQQIEDAYHMGCYRQKIYEELDLSAAEQYYNQKYGGK